MACRSRRNRIDHIEKTPTKRYNRRNVCEAIKKTQNWKAPGVEGLHNFWWNNFKAVHSKLTEFFNQAASDPKMIPDFFTQGITNMLYKSGDMKNPRNYRPITCSPTNDKILTSIFTMKLTKHIENVELLHGSKKDAQDMHSGVKTSWCLITLPQSMLMIKKETCQWDR